MRILTLICFCLSNLGLVAQITLESTVNDPLCSDELGSIAVVANGGMAPYTYQWSDGQVGPEIDGLAEGLYYVTVSDQNGTTAAESYAIEAAPPHFLMNTILTEPACNVANGGGGSLSVIAMGGTPPYSYEWDGPMGIENTAMIDGLMAGQYCVTVRDANMCELQDCYSMVEPTEIVINAMMGNPSCNANNAPVDGWIDITVSGGTTPYVYTWSKFRGTNVDVDAEDQTNLGAGDYVVMVEDANGCTSQVSFLMVEPEELVLQADHTEGSCVDHVYTPGRVRLNPEGGLPPYSFEWMSPKGYSSTEQHLEGVESGNYYVTVSDANGCTVERHYLINYAPSLSMITTDTDVVCGETEKQLGTINIVSIVGGVEPYTFEWEGEGVVQGVTSQVDLQTGKYSVTVRDAECAEQTIEFTIDGDITNEPPTLCMVSNDNSNGHNTLYWEDPADGEYSKYVVYRETSTFNEWEVVGEVPAGEANIYEDKNANPAQQSYRYYVVAANDCNMESSSSQIHKTIHLVISQGLNGQVNLQWDLYNGVAYDRVRIYRGSSPDELEPYAEVASNVFSYTDVDPLSGPAFYQVVIDSDVSCSYNAPILSIRSNVASDGTSSVGEVAWVRGIEPSPFSDELRVDVAQACELVVLDAQGRVVAKRRLVAGSHRVDSSQWISGLYFVRLVSAGQVGTWRGLKGQ